MTVRELLWRVQNEANVTLILSPSSAAPGTALADTAYGGWTLSINGVQAALSEATATADANGNRTLTFSMFFDGVTPPTPDQQVAVCLTADGSDCPGATAVPPDTTLSRLDLESTGGTAIALTPTFDAGTTQYTATVANDVETVEVDGQAARSTWGATVEYAPADADSQTGGHQVSLDEGDNTITATVTSAVGEASTVYTIVVTREVPTLLWSATMTVGYVTSSSSPMYGHDRGSGANTPSNLTFDAPGGAETTVVVIQWDPEDTEGSRRTRRATPLRWRTTFRP